MWPRRIGSLRHRPYLRIVRAGSAHQGRDLSPSQYCLYTFFLKFNFFPPMFNLEIYKLTSLKKFTLTLLNLESNSVNTGLKLLVDTCINNIKSGYIYRKPYPHFCLPFIPSRTCLQSNEFKLAQFWNPSIVIHLTVNNLGYIEKIVLLTSKLAKIYVFDKVSYVVQNKCNTVNTWNTSTL